MVNVEGFCPPLLLSVSDNYSKAKVRIVVYGQETLGGWCWSGDELCQYKYPNREWPFVELNTFDDFLGADSTVDALVYGYKLFEFAKYQPLNYRSPFWTAFRQVQNIPNSGVTWSNLVRADYEGGSVRLAPEETRNSFLIAQAVLLREELKILAPHACIFFTGPTYDPILEGIFPDVNFQQIGNEPVRKLAQLAHPLLPLNSYRTYHPGYLRRSRQWRLVDEVCERLNT